MHFLFWGDILAAFSLLLLLLLSIHTFSVLAANPKNNVTHLRAWALRMSRPAPVQDSFASSTRPMRAASQNFTFLCPIPTFPVSFTLSSPGVMSSRFYLLFFPPRGHEPQSTFRDRINLHFSLQWCCFPYPRYTKHPDVALYVIHPIVLLPTPSSTYCILNISDTIYFGSRPPLIFSCAALS